MTAPTTQPRPEAHGVRVERARDEFELPAGDDDTVFQQQLALLRRHLLSDPRSLRSVFVADGVQAIAWEFQQPELGASVTGRGYTFLGVTYEPATRQLEVMVSEAAEERHHLTRSVPRPDAITLSPAAIGAGEVLDIRHGQQHTIVTVLDPAPPRSGA